MYPSKVRREALDMLAGGASVNAVSKAMGISRSAISDWRDRGPASLTTVNCPAPAGPTEEYSALLGYYLGDGCISRLARTYSLRVSCDATYPGIIADVTHCLGTVHPARPVFHVRAPGMIVVQSSWKHWPCLFPQHGPGRKHERALELADWQRPIVEEHPAAFLRGLFHSDGCRVDNWATRTVQGRRKRYEYGRWQFVNASADIRGFCANALDLLDIPWRQSGRRTISVSRQEAVARLDRLIGRKA